jgi:DeoR family transcriptional regulator, aga operon transcriptional repressor
VRKNIRSLSRQEKIMQLLLASETLSVSDLAQQLGVSAWTIRRDLSCLEKQQLLARHYGEAKVLESQTYESFTWPRTGNDDLHAAKRVIGRAAARLVQAQQHVALSAGTTTSEVAKALRERDVPCYVVTNALNIAMELSLGKHIRATCTGGEVDGDYSTLNGPIAERVLKGHYFDIAIIGVSGVALEEGLTVNSQLNAVALEMMLQHSKKIVVVADHAKFGTVRFAHLAPLDRIDVIVTETAPAKEFLEHFRGKGVEVIVATQPYSSS